MKKEVTGYPSIDKPWLKYYPNNAYVKSLDLPQKSFYEQLFEYNRTCLNNDALLYLGTKITFKDLFDNIDKVACCLLHEGIRKNDKCIIVLPNIPELVYLIYAINKIGAVSCLIDPRTNPEEIARRANEADAKILFALSDIADKKIKSIIKDLKVEKIVFCKASESAKALNIKRILLNIHYLKKSYEIDDNRIITYKEFIKNADKNINFVNNYEVNQPAIIVYTSGTTGVSKGVVLTNDNINASRLIQNYVPTDSDIEEGKNHLFLAIIPFFSSYGVACGMNSHLSKGWTLALIPIFDSKDFGKLIIKYKVRSVLGVPRFWEEFAIENKNVSLNYLKDPICGGDKISPASVEKINNYLYKHGANRLKIGYGASEFTGAIVVTTDFGAYVPGSVGEPLPGVDVMIINPDTNEQLKYNEVGELCFRSPTMMASYFKNEEETRIITVETTEGEFYRTGDKGYVNENGQVFVIDRYKRAMMRPDGHTVHATPIENVIKTNKSIKDCAVVGLKKDEKAGVIPTAFICLNKDIKNPQQIIDEIDNLCLQKLPERDKAHIYTITDDIPYTLNGKIDYEKLEKIDIKSIQYTIKDYTFFS